MLDLGGLEESEPGAAVVEKRCDLAGLQSRVPRNELERVADLGLILGVVDVGEMAVIDGVPLHHDRLPAGMMLSWFLMW